MRISCDQTDPGFDRWAALGAHSASLEIWLDGQKLDDCITADTGEGIAICYAPDQYEPHMKELPRVERRGHVKIMFNGGVLASSRIPDLVGEHPLPFLAEHAPAIKRTLSPEEGAGETVNVTISFPQGLERRDGPEAIGDIALGKPNAIPWGVAE